jgi:hypothetical protein
MNREQIVKLGEAIVQWARPAGWTESPLAVSLFAMFCITANLMSLLQL